MQENKLLKKLMVILLIFTMTFANFAFVTKSYAAGMLETIFGTESDTGSSNIQFEAFFENNGEKVKSVQSDVNSTDLAIKFNLNVLDSGYLKNARIEVLESEEGKGLNFEIGKNNFIENSETTKPTENSIEEQEVLETPSEDEQVLEEQEALNENNTEEVEENINNEVQDTQETNLLEENVENEENVEVTLEPAKIENFNTELTVVNLDEYDERSNEGENAEENSTTVNLDDTSTDEIVLNENTNEEQVNGQEENENAEAVQEETENENAEIVQEETEVENIEEVQEEVVEEETEEILFPEYVQALEDNVLLLNQIDSVSNVNIDLPIKYKNELYVNPNIVSNSCKIKFSGTYIDGQGNEIEVSKEEVLTVNWLDEREIEVETGTTKFIDYGEGIILQTVIDLNNSKEGNRLPIKNTEIRAEVPSLGGIKPEKVLVVANTLEGTNGEKAGNVVFNESNWNYNIEENVVEINVNNEEKLMKESEYSDEYVIEEEKEENRVYNGNGEDEYLLTFTYPGISIEDTEEEIVANINAKIVLINNEEIINNNNYAYNLNGAQGDIVSLRMDTESAEISKAYSYINLKKEGTYETEIENSTIINVSYKDLIENLKLEDLSNTYIDKEENVRETEDLYYKKIEISKDNFDSMLGEGGEILVTGPNGEEAAKINSTVESNEEGNIEVYVNGRFSKLNYEITKPISEGNIVIKTTKALTNLSIDKESLVNLDELETKSTLKANYEFVDEEVAVEEKAVETKLKDTVTEAKIVMDRDSLSTLSENEDVEIRIELNNSKPESDIYGHSVFEVELPEYIENLEITNANILYGEGLSITEIVPEGRILRITLDGMQDGINSGVITNGTNIVINANIKVNLYTPAKSEEVKLRYTNDEATNYSNNGEDSFKIKYSAPTGLVAVNSITGFNGEESKVQSVRQGRQTGIIDIYSEAKVATEEIVVMNNYGNTISNVSILGRFPYKGVTDILTGDDLGTTIDVKLLSGITSDERNNTNVKVYYSTNGDADKNLDNELNKWVENPESLEGMKSYLIVPEEGYEMKDTDVLRFVYNYEVPENLEHNEKIAGTFIVDYRNNSEIIPRDEKEPADIVDLSTGEGPELEVELVSNEEEVKEFSNIIYTLKVKNVGDSPAKNIEANISIPNNVIYIESNSNDSKAIVTNESLSPYINIKYESLDVNEEFSVDNIFEVKRVNIVSDVSFEHEGKTYYGILKDFPETYIEINATINAEDLGKEKEIVSNKAKVTQAYYEISQEFYNTATDKIHSVGDNLCFRITLTSRLVKTQENVVLSQKLPEDFEFVNCYRISYDKEAEKYVEIEDGSYNESTNTIVWNIDKLKGLSDIENDYELNNYYIYEVKVKDFSGGENKKDITFNAEINNNIEIGKTNDINVKIGKPVLVINQVTDNTNTYIKPGDIVKYTFTVKNEGQATANDVELVDVVPDKMVINKITYTDPVGRINETYSQNGQAIIRNISLEAGQEIKAEMELKASIENDTSETTVNNYGVLNAYNANEITSNSITHIIQGNSQNYSTDDTPIYDGDTNSYSDNIVQTYRIEGTAWEDTNKDGMRSSNEKLLSGITVRLINSQGLIENNTKTDSTGNYSFIGIPNGNYAVIFEYDTTKYMVTTYKKDGVSSEVNSDAISTRLEQNGKITFGAITDVITISNSSVLNIDLGLALADKFDLSIDKTITKITTQTSKGITTDNYKNVRMAKTEIASKNLRGSVVYVEYEIKVSNVGDISGYAKKIVDYIPAGMKFNSSLEANADWYTGTDGNLYSTKFENTELSKGESRTLKLVLTKEMTEENTGINNNQVEIYEDYNIYGVTDKNSTPGNKVQNENDLSYADAVILIKTGETFIYISVFISSLLIGIVLGFIIYNKIESKKRKAVV